MIELTHTSHFSSANHIEEIAPDAMFCVVHDSTLRVHEGVICVTLEEHDVILTPGDEVMVRAREARRILNAGDEPAHVSIAPVTASLPAFEPQLWLQAHAA
jgi:quercetin dioxygenase-like cupin family protein